MTEEIVRWPKLLCIAAALATFLPAPSCVQAQLRMKSWRADNGEVYQMLQFRAGEDLGSGLEEILVTSVVASGSVATACATPVGDGVFRSPVEAVAFGPVAGLWPLAMSYKSQLIGDASPPCFDASAGGGAGRVCVGPGCTSLCECVDDNACFQFSRREGVSLGEASPGVPQAQLITGLRLRQSVCRVDNSFSYAFGAASAITTKTGLCGEPPADGFRLSGAASAFDGGTPGTTIIFAYQATPSDLISVAAAGYGIDSDGVNPVGCRTAGRVVAGLEASSDDDPVVFPPAPPVALDLAEIRCQSAIGRSGRRLAMKWMRTMQLCRQKILSGSWPISSAQCAEQPLIAHAVRSAIRVARSGLAVCRRVDMSRLHTCGVNVDELVPADGSGGCLFETHRAAAEEMVVLEYGF